MDPLAEESSRLQARKSSFQAWKCVSFGYAMLALVLLGAKWQEVSTDLHLLVGIERLLAASQTIRANGSVPPTGGPSQPLSWPPVPLEMLVGEMGADGLGESNATRAFGMESLESNGTMLMSHMQMSLSRELSGSHLLRQEVEAFQGGYLWAYSAFGLGPAQAEILSAGANRRCRQPPNCRSRIQKRQVDPRPELAPCGRLHNQLDPHDAGHQRDQNFGESHRPRTPPGASFGGKCLWSSGGTRQEPLEAGRHRRRRAWEWHLLPLPLRAPIEFAPELQQELWKSSTGGEGANFGAGGGQTAACPAPSSG